MSPYLRKPDRTMWDAARDIFEYAHKTRDAELWERAYRLWVQASAFNAKGVPFMITHYRPVWLPTQLEAAE